MSKATRGELKRGSAIAAALAASALLATAGSASARPVTWAGSHFYTGPTATPVPQTIMLSVNGSRVRLTSLQVITACAGVGGAQPANPEIAFTAVSSPEAIIRGGRFSLRATDNSGGRSGSARVSGTLRANGRGTASVAVSTVGRDSGSGAVIERCSASVTFGALRRGR